MKRDPNTYDDMALDLETRRRRLRTLIGLRPIRDAIKRGDRRRAFDLAQGIKFICERCKGTGIEP